VERPAQFQEKRVGLSPGHDIRRAQTNLEIETGGWRPLNMERPPFGFPAPLRAIDEKCLHTGGIYADKRLALWRLADIA